MPNPWYSSWIAALDGSHDPVERSRRTRVLAMVLVLLVVDVLGALLVAILLPQRPLTPAGGIGVGAGLVVAYGLARWWRPQAGAFATVITVGAVVWWSARFGPAAGTVTTLVFLVLPLLVGPLVGSFPATVLATAVGVVALLDPRVPVDPVDRAGLLVFILVTSAILQTSASVREHEVRRLEREHRDLEVFEGRFFEEAPTLLAIADHQGRFLKLNAHWERVLGWPRDELVNRPFLDLVVPDDRAATTRENRRLVRGGSPMEFENRYRTRGGSSRWLRWVSISRPEDGRIYAIARDVTAEKALASRLEAEEARLQSLIDNAPVGIFVAEPGGRILEVNRALTTMLGYANADEVLAQGFDPTDLYDFPGGDGVPLDRSLPAGTVVDADVTARRRDGTTFPARVSFVLLDQGAEEVPILLGIARDLTLERQLQEALAAREAQRARSEELERITRVASHELQEPIRDVIRFAQRFERMTASDLGEDERESLEFIVKGTRRLHRVIEGIRAYADVTSRVPEPRPVDVAPLVRAAAALDPGDEYKTESLEVHVEVEEGLAVAGDRHRLGYVIDQILANAARFAADRVEVRAVARNGDVEITVADDGPGLDPAQRERAFELFSRLHARTAPGLGIGLALSRGIVRQYGGSISLEGRDGGGTLVRVRWPIWDGQG